MAKHQIHNVGILGGSFDPAHRGHLAISRIAIKKLKLKKVYWIVTKRNPFKKKSFFSIKKRIAKAKKIAKSIQKIQVLYIDEIINSSRSIDTIRYIFKYKKPKIVYFIIGSDILLDLHKWKDWRKLVKLTKLIVFSRKGYDRNRVNSVVAKYLKNKKIKYIKNKRINISSSSLRRKLK